MTDTNGDDVADTFEKFSDFVGGIQEHGPHAIRRGPDGIPTIILGNNTFYPDEMVNPAGPLGGAGTPNPSRESQFLPALPDGRGFGPSVKEGLHGTIARIDRRDEAVHAAGRRAAQRLRLRVQSRRRNLHVRQRHGMGHQHALVSRRADRAWHSRRQLRLSQRLGQVPAVFHRLAAERARPRPRIAGRRRVLSAQRLPEGIPRRATSKPTGRAAACSGPASNAPARPTRRRRRRTSSSTASRSTSPTWKSGRTA